MMSKVRLILIRSQAKSQDIAMIDNDYQMLDSHVDKGICNKIVNFDVCRFR